MVRPLVADAVISRPGPQEPEKGLPGPVEDNRSAESEGQMSRVRARSISRDPREVYWSRPEGDYSCNPKRSLPLFPAFCVCKCELV